MKNSSDQKITSEVARKSHRELQHHINSKGSIRHVSKHKI